MAVEGIALFFAGVTAGLVLAVIVFVLTFVRPALQSVQNDLRQLADKLEEVEDA